MGRGDKYVTVSHSKHKGMFQTIFGPHHMGVGGDKYAPLSHFRGGGTNMLHCHTFKRKQVHGQGGQICHSVTLQTKGEFSKEGGTDMSHGHTLREGDK